MLDVDTFLTTLYVMVDDFCNTLPPAAAAPGRPPSLTRSEVVTLGLFSQWGRWASQRDFYRYAQRQLRAAFPQLPDRSQFNRLLRQDWLTLVAFAVHLASQWTLPTSLYQALDATALPMRNAKRRGRSWFAGQANIGWSLRLGWYDGFHLLTAVTPDGLLTGWGFGAASAKDQPLAEAFLALRAQPQPGYAGVGAATALPYVADAGFAGRANQRRWTQRYGAQVISPPQANSKPPWPWPWRRWLNGVRQIVETVNAKLHHTFALERRRPHSLDGLHTWLAATAALHNFCFALNRLSGRPALAFADLIDW
jgi:hypothetical protein